LRKPKDEREGNGYEENRMRGCNIFYPLICAVSPSSGLIPPGFLTKILLEFLNFYTDSEAIMKLRVLQTFVEFSERRTGPLRSHYLHTRTT
jgi:hypothetical protein